MKKKYIFRIRMEKKRVTWYVLSYCWYAYSKKENLHQYRYLQRGYLKRSYYNVCFFRFKRFKDIYKKKRKGKVWMEKL